MSTITKEQLIEKLQHRISVASGFPESEKAQIDLELARIALASLEAGPVGYIDAEYADLIKSAHIESCSVYSEPGEGCIALYAAPPAPANAEPVAWLWSHRKHPSEVSLVRPEDDERAEGAHWSGWSCQALYAVPPAQVSEPDRSMFEKWWESEHGSPLDSWDSLRTTDGYCDDGIDGQFEAWNACRAAMLQGAEQQNRQQNIPENIPATQFKPVADLYGLTSPTGSETSFTFDAVEARDFIDGGWSCQEYVELGRFQEAVSGNSPVIPDGWVACSERMPETDGNYWGWWSESKRQGPVWFIKSELQAQFQSSEITHWMALPAAPQQEVK
ncbi:DUF551 domain-containing protein [Enterobacter roggenkampii]|uniref:DUF551 domain-containing protein n=1 Tax=Enterobacter roggenkampii TaxID=1812935 RepID=UPI002005D3D7|nr:DUF551 domain-containing protein [Enterobacter roggenkampii]MCK6769733.1 DUF551 domain-containing protein [Enterobacter roggenkampii]